MANIKLSPLLSDITGKIGGSIFQNNQAGKGVKSFSHNINPNSVSQTLIRNFTFHLQQEWKSVTSEQKAIWKAFVEYSQVKQNRNKDRLISNMQCFIKFNLLRLISGYNIIYEPIFENKETPNISGLLYICSGRIYVIFDRDVVSTDEFVIINVSYPISPGLNRHSNQLRFIASPNNDTNFVDITDQYLSVFGEMLTLSHWVFLKITVSNKANGFYYNNSVQKVQPLLCPITPIPTAGLLDAWSLNKVIFGYSGYCVRIIRASDNNSEDFGFVNGYVDMDNIAIFLLGTTGKVVIFFNQVAGGERIVIQAGGNMPAFVPYVGIVCNGLSGLQLTNATLFNNDTPYSVFSDVNIDVSGGGFIYGSRNSPNYRSGLNLDSYISYFYKYTLNWAVWSIPFAVNSQKVLVDNTGGLIDNLGFEINGVAHAQKTFKPDRFEFKTFADAGNNKNLGFKGSYNSLFIWDRVLTTTEKNQLFS